jgi:hypothetical protein
MALNCSWTGGSAPLVFLMDAADDVGGVWRRESASVSVRSGGVASVTSLRMISQTLNEQRDLCNSADRLHWAWSGCGGAA